VVPLVVLLGCGGATTSAQPPGDGADDAPEAATDEAAVAGDGSGAADGATAAPGDEDSGPAPQAAKPSKCDANKAPEGETDNQRRRRLKREKIEECQTVAAAIQKAQLQDTIASVNDKAQLTKVSGQLTRAAQELEQLEVCVEGLRKLRDEYSGRARTMSAALGTASKTTVIEEQKAAVAEFRKLHPLQTAFVNKINEFCNAPVE
jgi:hypothetical protein